MGRARQARYLEQRGWTRRGDAWHSPREPENGFTLGRALHHQLTYDLAQGLSHFGWRVVAYSPRGYAQLVRSELEKPCTLPAALRQQAKREGRRVGEFTYELFLAATVDEPSS